MRDGRRNREDRCDSERPAILHLIFVLASDRESPSVRRRCLHPRHQHRNKPTVSGTKDSTQVLGSRNSARDQVPARFRPMSCRAT